MSTKFEAASRTLLERIAKAMQGNLFGLVPQKKTVRRKGKVHQQTYYIQPNQPTAGTDGSGSSKPRQAGLFDQPSAPKPKARPKPKPQNQQFSLFGSQAALEQARQQIRSATKRSTPAAKPAERPVAKPAEKPAAKPQGKPAPPPQKAPVKSADKPAEKTAQKPAAANAILPPAEQNGMLAKRTAKLLAAHGLEKEAMAGQQDLHVTLKNPPYMDLVVERLADKLYLTHYLGPDESTGFDLVMDNELVFKVGKDGSLHFKEVAGRSPLGGEWRVPDRKFANMFTRNLIHQGFENARLERGGDEGAAVAEEPPEPPATDAAEHDTALLAKWTDAENGVSVRLARIRDGYSVSLWDDDAEQSSGQARVYPSFDQALSAAREKAGTGAMEDILLREGDTKVENGRTYRLNQNHRWERLSDEEQSERRRQFAEALSYYASMREFAGSSQEREYGTDLAVSTTMSELEAALGDTDLDDATRARVLADLHRYRGEEAPAAAPATEAKPLTKDARAYLERLLDEKKKAYAEQYARYLTEPGAPEPGDHQAMGLSDEQVMKIVSRLDRFQGPGVNDAPVDDTAAQGAKVVQRGASARAAGASGAGGKPPSTPQPATPEQAAQDGQAREEAGKLLEARIEEIRKRNRYDEGLDLSKLPSFGFDKLPKATKTTRLQANQEAIRLAEQLTAENRLPTVAEREILAAYTGDGGVTGDINAHYTPTSVAAGMWRLLHRAGFQGGRVLEPSMGAGVFFETAPEGARMTGVELSETTSKVSRLLHPTSEIHGEQPFERFNTEQALPQFDAIIANPPYGVRDLYASIDKPEIKSAERYFIETSLDRLKDGGQAAFLINGSPFEAGAHRDFRARMLCRAEVLGLYQLPSSTFKESGSGVPPIVVLMRKRPNEVGRTLERLYEKHGEDVLEAAGIHDGAYLNGELLDRQENIFGSWDGERSYRNYKDVKGTVDEAVPAMAEAGFREEHGAPKSFSELSRVMQRAGITDEDGLVSAKAYADSRDYPIAEGSIHPNGRWVFRNHRWHSLEEGDAALGQAIGLADDLEQFMRLKQAEDPRAEGVRQQLKERVDAYIRAHGDPNALAGVKEGAKKYHKIGHLLAAVNGGGAAAHLSEPVKGKALRVNQEDASAVARHLYERGTLTPAELARNWTPKRGGESAGAFASEDEAREYLMLHFALDEEGRFVHPDDFYYGDIPKRQRSLREAAAKARSAGDESLARKYESQAQHFRELRPEKTLEEIYATPRDKWLPLNAIEAFVEQVVDPDSNYTVREQNGVYYIEGGSSYVPENVKAFQQYMNHSTVVDAVRNQKDKSKEEVEAERKAAIERAKALEDKFSNQFQNWVGISDYRELVEKAYNERVNNHLTGHISDAPLHIPGWQGPPPHPFQNEGVRFMSKAGSSINAFDVGLGKALSWDTMIMTPTGMCEIGSLRVGAKVIGSSGKPTTVMGVYPQGVRKAYEVVFSDGVKTICDGEHLWNVQTALQKSRGLGFRTLTLNEILKEGLLDRRKSKSYRHFIPMVQPVEFEERDLPVDPYALGLLLGDGNMSRHFVGYSSKDDELVGELAARLPAGVTLRKYASSAPYDYRLTAQVLPAENERNKAGQFQSTHPLLKALRELGLLGATSQTKFVPEVYKFASRESRILLLQGLLDTDGHVRPRDNNVEFSSASLQLAEDVAFLVQSLGGVARLREKGVGGKTYYRMSIIAPPSVALFRLGRKAKVYRPRAKYLPSRAIVAVNEVAPREMVCIAVDAPDALYVADHFVVTHNTFTGCALLAYEKSKGRAKKPFIVAPKSLMKNWRENLKKTLPHMNVLIIGESEKPGGGYRDDDTPDVAKKLVQAAVGEYDAVIISRDWFGSIPLKEETWMRMVEADVEAKRKSELMKEDSEAYVGQKRRKKGKTPREEAQEDAKARQKAAAKLFKHMVTPIYFEDLGVDWVMSDEAHCFPAGTLIDGRPIESYRAGDTVRAFDHRTGRIVKGEVLNLQTRTPKDLYRVTLEDGSEILCTGKHPFFTQEGYVFAEDVRAGDTVYRANKNLHDTVGDERRNALPHLPKGVHAEPVSTRTLAERGGAEPVLLEALRQHCAQLPQGCLPGGARQGELPPVRDGVYSEQDPGLEAANEGRNGLLLLQILLQLLAYTAAARARGGARGQYAPSARTARADAEDARKSRRPGSARQDAPDAGAHWPPAEGARRQRQGVDGAAAASNGRAQQGLEPALRTGVFSQDTYEAGQRLSRSVQGGPGESRPEAGHRSGREVASLQTPPGPRPEEGGDVAPLRVVGVEAVQPTGDGTFGGLCPGGVVYNIEVEKHHNYFAEDVLVHNSYKNLHSAPTTFGKQPKFMGGGAESKRASDFLYKSKLIRDKTGGNGVHLLTATPTKNSPLEVFNMMKLVTDDLEQMGIPTVDDFVTRYCDISDVIVPNPAGELEVVPGVRGFKNLTEMRDLMSRRLARKTAEDVGLKLPERVDHQQAFEMDPVVASLYRSFAESAKAAAKDRGAKGEDHLFSWFAKMRKLTLDPALIDPSLAEKKNPRYDKAAELSAKALSENGKVVMFMDMGQQAAGDEDMADAYETMSREGLMAVAKEYRVKDYESLSTTKLRTAVKQAEEEMSGNAYDRLVEHLVERGVPREKIAVANAKTVATSAARGQIEDDFNAGKKPIVIGSTPVIGEGFNLQKGTTDMIHLDTPWDPGTYWQRLGRAVRQGNPQEQVRNHVLMAKGSFDGLTYSTMLGKKGWMDHLWESGSDTGSNDSSSQYEEMLIMAQSDPEAAAQALAAKKEEIAKKAKDARRVTAIRNLSGVGRRRAALAGARQRLESAHQRLQDATDKLSQEPDPEKRTRLEAEVAKLSELAKTYQKRQDSLSDQLMRDTRALAEDPDLPEGFADLLGAERPFLADDRGGLYVENGTFSLGNRPYVVHGVDHARQKVIARPLYPKANYERDPRAFDLSDLSASRNHSPEVRDEDVLQPLLKDVTSLGPRALREVDPERVAKHEQELQSALKESGVSVGYVVTPEGGLELRDDPTGLKLGPGERFLINTPADMALWERHYPHGVRDARGIPFQFEMNRVDDPSSSQHNHWLYDIDDTPDYVVKAQAGLSLTLPAGVTLAKAQALSGRRRWHGLDISIECDKGETRSKTSAGGKTIARKMHYPYGYIRRTVGIDGDHIDCFLGPDENATTVYVVHQVKPATGQIDEDKVMLNFSSAQAAKAAYLKHYPGAFFGSLTEMPVSEFVNAVKEGRAKGRVMLGQPHQHAGQRELRRTINMLRSAPEAKLVLSTQFEAGGRWGNA